MPGVGDQRDRMADDPERHLRDDDQRVEADGRGKGDAEGGGRMDVAERAMRMPRVGMARTIAMRVIMVGMVVFGHDVDLRATPCGAGLCSPARF